MQEAATRLQFRPLHSYAQFGDGAAGFSLMASLLVAALMLGRGSGIAPAVGPLLPLVMLGLWTSVADESQGPFGAFTSDHFVAYYLVALILRNVTGSWVVWQVDMDIRNGTMSMRLLRPYFGSRLRLA